MKHLTFSTIVFLQKIAAASLYAEQEKKKFSFMHCHHVLQGQPKWSSLLTNKRQKTTGGASSSSSRRPPECVNLEDDAHVATEERLARPLGCKAAKAAQRRAAASASSDSQSALKDHFEALSAHNAATVASRSQIAAAEQLHREEALQIERERNQIMQTIEDKKLKLKKKEQLMKRQDQIMKKQEVLMKQQEHDERIMEKDLTNLDDEQKMYYKLLRKKIVEKAMADA